jgi:hypothetical protein
MAAISLPTIIEGTVENLRLVEGIGTVAAADGEHSPWGQQDPGKSLWIVSHERTEVRLPGASSVQMQQYSSRVRRIVVDGWMPLNSSGNSAVVWRGLMDSVLLRLSERLGQGVCAKVIEFPELEYNRLDFYTSLNQGDVQTACHHCRMGFTVFATYLIPTTAS